MIQETILSRTLRLMCSGAMLAGAGVMLHPACAQEKIENIERVQITGSRITSPGITSNSPISSITAEEMKSSQPVAVEESIKNLAVAAPAVGPGTNNGTGGGATIDLRGLGANRTLVLVNDRRMVPFDLLGRVDTNSIPIALLNRADLLTGGASVVYGADAVSGVVNFKLKRHFTGVDLSSSYGISDEHDAKRKRTDLTMGAALDGGKGNVVLSIGKTSTDPLTQGARPFGVTTFNSVNGTPSGSATGLPAIISVATPNSTVPNILRDNWQINPATGALVQPVQLYNTNPANYYATGLERNQVTALGNYKINDQAEVYSDIFYTNSKVASTLAASGTFFNVYQVPIGNPYLPQAARQQICAQRAIAAADCVIGNGTLVPMSIGRRFTELGPRYNNFDNKTLQYTIGLKGEIAYDWSYDAYWTRGNADQTQTRQNWGSLSKVSQALNALSTNACANPANGCVPLNVFGTEGSITPDQLKFVNQSALLMQSVQQDVAALNLSGDLGQLQSPWAGLPVSLALGAEQRKVSANTVSDAASQINGEVLGTGAPNPDRAGQFKLTEFLVESVIPLVKDKPFARALNVELGYRRTEFATSEGKTSSGSYKYGGEWAPVPTLRLRGMMQKATRAPNVNELYAPPVTSLSNLAVDPCQGTNVNQADVNTAGTLSNLCRLTGVPANQVGSLPKPSSGQANILTSGNIALGPEEAKTKTIGFVLEPLRKLAISLDYYKIDIEKAILQPSITDIVDSCYNTAFNPGLAMNGACGQIGRGTLTGTFNGVDSAGVQLPYSNLGNQHTSGFDLNVGYKLTLSTFGLAPRFGALDLGMGFNQTQTWSIQTAPTALKRDCLGFYSVACGAPNYKRKFSQRTTWTVGDVSVGYNWRYLSALDEEPGGTDFLPAFSHIGAYHYLDLSAVWNFSKNLRLNLSVTNAFDKKPPIIGGTIGTTSTNSGNTFPQNYDTVGRYIALGASLKF